MGTFPIDLQNGTATITLAGRLDASVAPQLSDDLKTLMDKDVSAIVFEASGLDYISSAGLRAMVFAKQKIGDNVDVSLVGAKPDIQEVVKMTGFDSFVTIK